MVYSPQIFEFLDVISIANMAWEIQILSVKLLLHREEVLLAEMLFGCK